MSLKCKGCGIKLQSKDIDKSGYVLNDIQEYCQRCYKLIHYGDISAYKRLNYNDNLIKLFNEHKNDLFVLIVDCYEALVLEQEFYLNSFNDKNILLVINKIDLLPRSITEDRIVLIYKNVFIKLKSEYKGLKDIIITHKNDQYFNDLFFDTIKELGYSTILFVGKTNAGKSTILNKLLCNSDLTTSIYPGTTVDKISFNHEKFEFIDTPGIDDEDNLITYIPLKKLKSYLRYKTVKPLIFQVYDKQSYYMSNLFRLDIFPNEDCSIVFESNRYDIHRTKYENRINYEKNNKFEFCLLPWNKNDYIVKDYLVILIKGFGLIRIKGSCNCTFMINDKIKLYRIEEFI